MTKSTKRKAARQADFQKQKLKLGKGKQAANNATDTSFKAKTIALPQQSINLDRSQSYTTRRGQTLNDLVVQTRHHSPVSRKDALDGVRELLTTHTQLATAPSSLRLVIPALLHLIGDDDARVRQTLLAFGAWLFPIVANCERDADEPSTSTRPPEAQNHLQPFLSQLLLYTTSALSHIYMAVRVDAAKFLEVLMTCSGAAGCAEISKGWASVGVDERGALAIPDGAGHAGSVLKCLLNMLGLSATVEGGSMSAAPSQAGSTNSMELPIGARLVVLRVLRRFLALVLASDSQVASAETDCPTWIFRSSFSSASDFESFERVLQRQEGLRAASFDISVSLNADDVPSTLGDYGGHGALTDSSVSVGYTHHSGDLLQVLNAASALSDRDDASQVTAVHGPPHAIFTALAPALLGIFVEVLPSASAHLQAVALMVPNSSREGTPLDVHGQILCVILEIALGLVRRMDLAQASPSIRKHVDALLEQASRNFPLGPSPDAAASSSFSRDAQTQLQALNLSFCEICARLSSVQGSRSQASAAESKSMRTAAVRLSHVQAYVTSLLTSSVDAGALALTSESLVSILPSAWLLLDLQEGRPSSAASSSIIAPLVACFCRTAAFDAVKRPLFAFLARLSLIERFVSYRGQFSMTTFEEDKVAMRQFWRALPRYLWDLATRRDSMANAVVSYLRHVALDDKHDLFDGEDVDWLRSTLEPFFKVRAGKSMAQRLDLDGLRFALQM